MSTASTSETADAGQNSAKHTPGPWYVNGSIIAPTPTGKRFAICEVFRDNAETANKNAILIASAPALLAERDALKADNDMLRAALTMLRDQCLEHNRQMTSLGHCVILDRNGIDAALATGDAK